MIVMLLSILLTISISACSAEQIDTPKVIYVSQKCKFDDVPKPDINNSYCTDYKCVAVKATSNYNLLRAYADELAATLDTCK
jgi:hypothetical protein